LNAPRLIAVTGGNGFVGQHFSRRARKHGFRLRQLSRQPASAFDPADEVHPFSLDAEAHPEEMLRGCDTLVHLAAHIPRDHRSLDEADLCWRYNVMGTLRLVEAAARSGISRFVQTSSANAYAPALDLPDESAAMFPASRACYLGSKMLQEICADEACRRAVMAHSVLRLSAVYGIGQISGIVPRFVDDIAHGRQIRLTGGGGFGADFVCVDDVAQALLLVIHHDYRGPLNVGSGERTTLATLTTMLVEMLERSPDLIRLEGDIGDDPGFPALDITRLRSLGLEPRALMTGLTEMVAETQSRLAASHH
jgi:UDP-glucose 4-epimerase